jgi:flagellar basal-body rod protein FlgB
MKVVGAAMRGLSAQQSVIANNIANVATPNYRARSLEFQDSLRSAVRAGSLAGYAPTSVDAGTPVKQDGNSVDMTGEFTKMDAAGLMFDALISAMNFRVGAIRGALSR